MSSLVARWLRRLARWCERLADDIDSHQHMWQFKVGTYGQQTCLDCWHTVLWERATNGTHQPHTPIIVGKLDWSEDDA